MIPQISPEDSFRPQGFLTIISTTDSRGITVHSFATCFMCFNMDMLFKVSTEMQKELSMNLH